MVSLIRLVQHWLWPVAAEVSTEVQDTSSMADLVRLLGTEHEPDASADGPGQANDADRSGS